MNRPWPLSVAGHHEWRESLAPQDSRFDEIDEYAADPIHDRPPSRRKSGEKDSLLDLLDLLDSLAPGKVEDERRDG
jgi:hypothetical protein